MLKILKYRLLEIYLKSMTDSEKSDQFWWCLSLAVLRRFSQQQPGSRKLQSTKGRLVLKVSLLMRKFTAVASNWESPFTSCIVFHLRNWQWALHHWSWLMCQGRGWEAAFEITAHYRWRIKAEHRIPLLVLLLVVSKQEGTR